MFALLLLLFAVADCGGRLVAVHVVGSAVAAVVHVEAAVRVLVLFCYCGVVDVVCEVLFSRLLLWWLLLLLMLRWHFLSL